MTVVITGRTVLVLGGSCPLAFRTWRAGFDRSSKGKKFWLALFLVPLPLAASSTDRSSTTPVPK
eukprot:948-Amphidinium_carterae.1